MPFWAPIDTINGPSLDYFELSRVFNLLSLLIGMKHVGLMKKFILLLFFLGYPKIAHANINPILISTGYASLCSGSFVAFEGYQPDHKGLYMTNGHCTKLNGLFGKYMEPNQIVVNVPNRKKIKLLINEEGLFGQKKVTLTTSKLLFATMSVRDIAIYELDLTYGEILDQFKIDPFIIKGTQSLKKHDLIEIPSGFWGLRWFCRFRRVSENNVQSGQYIWKETLILNRCDQEIVGGTSGSPTILSGTNWVVGLHNAYDFSTHNRCSETDACEIDGEGKVLSRKGDSFSQNIDFLLDCLDENSIFIPEQCELPQN